MLLNIKNEFIVKREKYRRLEKHYNDHGYNEAVRFVFQSKLEKYLVESGDISKIIELVSLPKRERSIVEYLNYLEDKKRTIMPSYKNGYNSINGAKLSPRQIKYKKARVNKLCEKELERLKSFAGVLVLDQDDLRPVRVKVKVKKITVLYTARIPLCNLDFKDVVASLNSMSIKSSEQDIIAFLSLIIELSNDCTNVNILASFWESIFGRDHVKDAKQVFEELGILMLVEKYIPGFKSDGYKIKLFDKLDNVEVLRSINMEISSISTLVKLNRIKRYKGYFTLNEIIEALQLIIDLRLKDIKMSGNTNLTNIFLESGRLQVLINDLMRMIDIMNDRRFYAPALSLGVHLTAYFNDIKKGSFKDYRPLYEKK